MLGTAIIVFREVLEAALIVSIVMAACKGIAGRNVWVSCGIVAGVMGAGLVAAFAASIAAAAAGIGQELFNAAILFLAVTMLGWHNVWMSRHGRELARQVGAVGQAVIEGSRPLYALALVTGVAVLREGSETVLFVYGIAAGGGETAGPMLSGGILGLALGIATGVALYFGLLRIPLRHLFAVTGWMILLLAAGMAAQGAGFLVQADVLPSLGNALWDSSALLNETSILGKMLHTLVGYMARPTGIQLVFYAATLIVISLCMQFFGKTGAPKKGRPGRTALMSTLLFGLVSLLAGYAGAARADFEIRYPTVDYRELEFEHNGSTSLDSRSSRNNNQSYTFELGYGLFPWWEPELEAPFNAPTGSNNAFSGWTWENTFQLAEPGEYWLLPGFFAQYSHAASRANADQVSFGPTVQREQLVLGQATLHTLNLFVSKQVGRNRNDATPVAVAWQSRARLNPFFEPGVEYYGAFNNIVNRTTMSDPTHRAGPVVVGAVNFYQYGKIKYEAGYLFGLNNATERGTVRWRFEYEKAF